MNRPMTTLAIVSACFAFFALVLGLIKLEEWIWDKRNSPKSSKWKGGPQ